MIQENKELLLYSTRGTSMFPFIRGNEYIVVKKVPLDSINLGDTIVFDSKGQNKTCHRVVRVEEVGGKLWFYTKGDKNNSFDEAVCRERILGKVIAVKRKASVIRLTANGMQLLLYKLNCFFTEAFLYIKANLAKIPFLKKIYRYIRSKNKFFLK